MRYLLHKGACHADKEGQKNDSKAPQEPYKLEDLDPASQKLKGWRLVKRMHEAALEAEKDTYIDPATGYTVFTSRQASMLKLTWCNLDHGSCSACSSHVDMP